MPSNQQYVRQLVPIAVTCNRSAAQVDSVPQIFDAGNYLAARGSASQASKRSIGQQLTMRSVGMPASLA